MAKKNIFTDAFGNLYVLKRFVIFLVGLVSYRRFNGFNKLKISGTEHLTDLPDSNVLFVSNHQTYFADVAAMYHVFCAVNNGYHNTIKNPIYLLNPKVDFYYVAAEETINKGFLARIFKMAGAISVKRTWRAAGQNVNRMVDLKEVDNIMKALDNGWVITFPQGTTKPWKPIRRGTAHIIKKNKPVVVPIVIDGFRRSFDKKGLRIKKRGILQSMDIKKPLEFDYENDTIQEIVEKLEYAIEQHPSFLKVIPSEEIQSEEELNKERQWRY